MPREGYEHLLLQSKVSVDPFSRNKRWATHTNDLNPATDAEYHMEARDFLRMLVSQGVKADLIIFDPPYSPRQITECYSGTGLTASMKDTQSAVLYMECRDLFYKLANPGCVALSFGWNSTGMGGEWVMDEDPSRFPWRSPQRHHLRSRPPSSQAGGTGPLTPYVRD